MRPSGSSTSWCSTSNQGDWSNTTRREWVFQACIFTSGQPNCFTYLCHGLFGNCPGAPGTIIQHIPDIAWIVGNLVSPGTEGCQMSVQIPGVECLAIHTADP